MLYVKLNLGYVLKRAASQIYCFFKKIMERRTIKKWGMEPQLSKNAEFGTKKNCFK